MCVSVGMQPLCEIRYKVGWGSRLRIFALLFFWTLLRGQCGSVGPFIRAGVTRDCSFSLQIVWGFGIIMPQCLLLTIQHPELKEEVKYSCFLNFVFPANLLSAWNMDL